MADVKWIKIVTDIFDDEKMLLIESIPDHDSIIVIWFKLLCLAGKNNNKGVFTLNDRIIYTDEMLSVIFRRPLNTIRLALRTFEEYGMIEIINNVITIPNWSKHQTLDQIEGKREYQRSYMAKKRIEQKQLAEGKKKCKANSETNSKANSKANCETNVSTIEVEVEVEVEKKKPLVTPAELSEFFDSIWCLYPKKEGKGQVSEDKKKNLYKIGYAEIKRAIERYTNAKKNTEKQYLQKGSTFFNSGYVDYLDNSIAYANKDTVTRDDLECLTDAQGKTVYEDVSGVLYDAIYDNNAKKITYVKKG